MLSCFEFCFDVFDGELYRFVYTQLLFNGAACMQYGRVVLRTDLLANLCQRQVGEVFVCKEHRHLTGKNDFAFT